MGGLLNCRIWEGLIDCGLVFLSIGKYPSISQLLCWEMGKTLVGVPSASPGIRVLEEICRTVNLECCCYSGKSPLLGLNGECDSLKWELNASGIFTTKSTFLNLTKRFPIAFVLVCTIWKIKVPKKVKFFLWSLSYRSLNTHDKLQRKLHYATLNPSMCCLCFRNEETLDQLFLHCEFVMKGWSFLFRILNLDCCLPSKTASWMLDGVNSKAFRPKGNILWRCTNRSLLWSIWNERNSRIFDDKYNSF